MDYLSTLPPEIIVKIYRFLSLAELVELRKCSRKLKNIVDDLILKELIVFNVKDQNLANSWYFSNQPIDYRHCLQLNTRVKFFHNLFFNMHKIKRIKIISPVNSICFKFKDLNRFRCLVELDLNLICFKREDEKLNLELLEYLSIVSYSPIKLEINCRNLKSFHYNHPTLSDITFKHQNSLTHIESMYFDEAILSFINLESISLMVGHQTDLEILSKLKNLKCLSLAVSSSEKCIQYFNNYYNELTELVDHLLQQRIEKDRKDFKLMVFGLEVEKIEEFMKINLSKSLFDLHMDNLSILKSATWFKEWPYKEQIINSDFFDIYTNLQKYVCEIRLDQKSFIDFLSHTPNLCVLELKYADLDDSFYNDHLPRLCVNLSTLRIWENKKLTLKFETFSRFNLLREFITNQNSSICSAIELLKCLKFFKTISFKNKEDSIMIRKLNNRFYNLDFIEFSPNEHEKKKIIIKDARVVFEQMTEALLRLEERVTF